MFRRSSCMSTFLFSIERKCSSTLGLRFTVDLEPRLRLLQLLSFPCLHVGLGVEQGRRNSASNGADTRQNERPSEPIVGMLWHPLVVVAEYGENYNADPTTDARCQGYVCNGLQGKTSRLFEEVVEANSLPVSI